MLMQLLVVARKDALGMGVGSDGFDEPIFAEALM